VLWCVQRGCHRERFHLREGQFSCITGPASGIYNTQQRLSSFFQLWEQTDRLQTYFHGNENEIESEILRAPWEETRKLIYPGDISCWPWCSRFIGHRFFAALLFSLKSTFLLALCDFEALFRFPLCRRYSWNTIIPSLFVWNLSGVDRGYAKNIRIWYDKLYRLITHIVRRITNMTFFSEAYRVYECIMLTYRSVSS